MASCARLLLVENDPSVREAVAMTASQMGFEVVLATSGTGEEALEIMSSGMLFDALYTDIRLGGRVHGWAVGQAFAASWPGKPIAYASASAPKPAGFAGPGAFLRKPFHLDDLEAILRPEGHPEPVPRSPPKGPCRTPQESHRSA
jgi:CheY-like chemotaxis protein